MRPFLNRVGLLSICFPALLLLYMGETLAQVAPSNKLTVPNCSKFDDSQVGFKPRAYTLNAIYVRAQAPEYSFLKGRWVLGQAVGTLPRYTCLHILERQEVGVIQIWYRVQYKNTKGQLSRGWVWGGTVGKDEGRYIGGDTTPPPMGSQGHHHSPEEPTIFSFSAPFSLMSIAYAQADVMPPQVDGLSNDEAVSSTSTPYDPSVYLVRIPILGWSVNFANISAAVLFLTMVAGMAAKAMWDQTETGSSLLPPKEKIIRPLLVSPIAFLGFWSPMYLQQGGGGLSLTMALYAFQIGFMWQHVLEKRIPSGGKVETSQESA